MIRGRQGAIVGVAIAVALMPPLAVMGFGLATWNLPILGGATFLFFTNLMAIGLSAAVLARIYGFGSRLSPQQTWVQASLVIGTLAAFACRSASRLRQIAWEALVTAAGARGSSRDGSARTPGSASSRSITMPSRSASARSSSRRTCAAARRGRPRKPSRGARPAGRGRHRAGPDRRRERRGGAARRGAGRGGGPDRRAVAERLALVAGVHSRPDPDRSRAAHCARPRRATSGSDAFAPTSCLRAAPRPAKGTGGSCWFRPPRRCPKSRQRPIRSIPKPQAALATAIWAYQRLEIPDRRVGAGAVRRRREASSAGVEARVVAPSSGPTRLHWLAPGT